MVHSALLPHENPAHGSPPLLLDPRTPPPLPLPLPKLDEDDEDENALALTGRLLLNDDALLLCPPFDRIRLSTLEDWGEQRVNGSPPYPDGQLQMARRLRASQLALIPHVPDSQMLTQRDAEHC